VPADKATSRVRRDRKKGMQIRFTPRAPSQLHAALCGRANVHARHRPIRAACALPAPVAAKRESVARESPGGIGGQRPSLHLRARPEALSGGGVGREEVIIYPRRKAGKPKLGSNRPPIIVSRARAPAPVPPPPLPPLIRLPGYALRR